MAYLVLSKTTRLNRSFAPIGKMGLECSNIVIYQSFPSIMKIRGVKKLDRPYVKGIESLVKMYNFLSISATDFQTLQYCVFDCLCQPSICRREGPWSRGQALKRGQLARHVAAKLDLTAAQSIIGMHSSNGMTPSIQMSSIVEIVKRACNKTILQ